MQKTTRWCGDLHPTRSTALSAAPVKWGYFNSKRAAKLVEHARGLLHGSSPTVILFGEVSTIAQFHKGA